MADTILIPKDTPDWQSLLSDVQASVSDAENYALATSSFTDRNGNTVKQGAKAWASDASSSATLAQNAETSVKNSKDAINRSIESQSSVDRLGSTLDDDIFALVDANDNVVGRINKKGLLQLAGLAGSVQGNLSFINLLLDGSVNGLGSTLKSSVGKGHYTVVDKNGDALLRIREDGELELAGLSSTVQTLVGQGHGDIYWSGSHPAQPHTSDNWRFWTFYEPGSLDTGEFRVFDGDGTDFPTQKTVSYSPPSTNTNNGIVRDPSVIYRAGSDKHLMLHTTSGKGDGHFAVAESTDGGLTWSLVEYVDLTGFSGISSSTRVWAPEWYVSPTGKLHVIAAIARSDQRIFTPDSSSFTSWNDLGSMFGAAVPNECIDTQVVKRDGRWFAVFKDQANTRVAFGTSFDGLLGPYEIGENPIEGITPGHYEGQQLLEVEPGKWRLYLDDINATSIDHLLYYETTDWRNWSGPTDVTIATGSPRHGCILPYQPA